LENNRISFMVILQYLTFLEKMKMLESIHIL